jgi:hypothetical protein
VDAAIFYRRVANVATNSLYAASFILVVWCDAALIVDEVVRYSFAPTALSAARFCGTILPPLLNL